MNVKTISFVLIFMNILNMHVNVLAAKIYFFLQILLFVLYFSEIWIERYVFPDF